MHAVAIEGVEWVEGVEGVEGLEGVDGVEGVDAIEVPQVRCELPASSFTTCESMTAVCLLCDCYVIAM